MQTVLKAAMITALLAVATAHPAHAASPSFDCTRATSEIEKRICADAALSKSDSDLAAAYQKTRLTLDAEGRHDLAVLQRVWLRNRGEECSSTLTTCLLIDYNVRIADLDNIRADKHHDITQVIFADHLREVFRHDPKDAQSVFGPDLAHDDASKTIVSCSMMVDVYLTRYETGQGALCLLTDHTHQPKPYLICNDTGVGHYQRSEAGLRPVSFYTLAQFTADHCTGG